jgi:hypothetical protein
MNPISRISAFKQVLGATGLSTVLMIMALCASKPRLISEFDGWSLRPSIEPSQQRGPEVTLNFLGPVAVDVWTAFADAAGYIECMPKESWAMNPCQGEPKSQFKISPARGSNYNDLRTASTTANTAATANNIAK